jgi:lipoate-protein ligase A
MQQLNLTLPSAAENVALDEALLEVADSSSSSVEVLRIWEASATAVVIGRSSRAKDEVDLPYCREQGIPVIRRCSGGAAVVLGRGCLMYSVVLSYALRPQLHMIDEVHRFVLGRIADALQDCVPNVRHQGISDLALNGRKVSGNSLRCKRHALLYHGTLLYDFPLEVVAKCLTTAPRQPEYRAGRDHLDFVMNLPVSEEQLRSVLTRAWPTDGQHIAWPREETAKLGAERYSRDDWNLRL